MTSFINKSVYFWFEISISFTNVEFLIEFKPLFEYPLVCLVWIATRTVRIQNDHNKACILAIVFECFVTKKTVLFNFFFVSFVAVSSQIHIIFKLSTITNKVSHFCISITVFYILKIKRSSKKQKLLQHFTAKLLARVTIRFLKIGNEKYFRFNRWRHA